jgi:hypothetical protein
MNTKTFFLFALIGLGGMTACSTQSIKEEITEQSQKPETIKEKQNLKAELASIILDETLMKKYLATQEAINQRLDNQTDEEKKDKEWLEKIVVDNGFDNMTHYEKVTKKINLLALHLAAQDPKIRSEVSKAKEEIKRELKSNSSKEDESWLEGTIKDVIADNIDSLVKIGDVIMQHSIKEVDELVKDVPEREKNLVRDNLDKLWHNNKNKVVIKV